MGNVVKIEGIPVSELSVVELMELCWKEVVTIEEEDGSVCELRGLKLKSVDFGSEEFDSKTEPASEPLRQNTWIVEFPSGEYDGRKLAELLHKPYEIDEESEGYKKVMEWVRLGYNNSSSKAKDGIERSKKHRAEYDAMEKQALVERVECLEACCQTLYTWLQKITGAIHAEGILRTETAVQLFDEKLWPLPKDRAEEE